MLKSIKAHWKALPDLFEGIRDAWREYRDEARWRAAFPDVKIPEGVDQLTLLDVAKANPGLADRMIDQIMQPNELLDELPMKQVDR